MWELDCEESWVPKNWCFWTVVLEKPLESPLNCKEIQQVYSKGDQSWVFFGRNDAEAETLVLWPPHAKSWLIGKDSDAERDWGQEEKGMTEDEMSGWHHRLNAHGFGWTPGVGDGQGGLACCGSWGRRVRNDWATELNWTETTTNPSVKQTEVIEESKEILLVHTFEQSLDCTYSSDRSPKVSIFFLPVPGVGKKTLVDTLMYICVFHWINFSF